MRTSFSQGVKVGALLILISAALSASRRVRAQSPPTEANAADKKTFDVASVKKDLQGYPPDGPPPHSNFPLDSGDAYVATGGLLNATNWPAYSYIGFAYKLTPTALAEVRAQLPKWAIEDHFDIQARAEANPTKDDMRAMVRALLADRLKLAVHMETRQAPIYDMDLEKSGRAGPLLQRHSDARPCYGGANISQNAAPAPEASAQSVQPNVPCGTLSQHLLPVGRLQVEARAIRMSQIADYLRSEGNLDRPVRDRTGLDGLFDYTLEWTPEGPLRWNGAAVQPDETGPTFIEALKEQLGLKLVSTTGPLDFLIIDHIEQPSSN